MGSFSVTTTGAPSPTVSESGPLPTGVTFNPATNVLSGTPTTFGTFSDTFTATNGVSPDATQPFTLVVNAAPVITSANTTTFLANQADSFTVTFTGFPAPSLSESGTLPQGVTFNSGTNTLSGTATAIGSYPITFTATNGVGNNASQSFTLVVNSTPKAPAITTTGSTTFTVGTADSFTVTASGTPLPMLSESGALPTGLTFNASTGLVSGIPTPGTDGSYTVTFTAANGVGNNATQTVHTHSQ